MKRVRAAIDEPSTRSSSSGSTAFSARRLRAEAGIARERRAERQPVSPRRKPAECRFHLGMAATLKPVGEDNDRRAARESGEARHCQEGRQRGADARAAVPIFHKFSDAGERGVAVAQAERRREAREARAERENLGPVGGVHHGVGELQIIGSVQLHRAGNVDEHEQPSLHQRAAAQARRRHVTVSADDGAQRAAKIQLAARERTHIAERATGRQCRGQLAAEGGETVLVSCKRAGREPFGRRSECAALLRQVLDGQLLARVAVVLHARCLVGFTLRDGYDIAPEIGAEERLEIRAAVRRRSEQGKRRLADVVHRSRAEKGDALHEGDGLFRRDRETGGAQHAGKTEEICGGGRKGTHASAFSMMGSNSAAR